MTPTLSKSIGVATAISELISALPGVSSVQTQTAPAFELEKITAREISVWTNNRESELLTRSTQNVTYSVAVALMERPDPSDNQEQIQDELFALAESIGDQLLGEVVGVKRLVDQQEVTETGTIESYQHTPLYDRELLEKKRVFAAGITLKFIREEPFR
jgi:hypothetical protein